ncbi:two-component response regulator-like APRR1 [Zingiber officinale]|uniref:two-component response regulator-like APRR1 n=1 Tax=Zingiber officinale TaxID=94328 RepID=UPI001C4DCF31|nr:two-component response regulator-like APRR1 [Zingiber officinale]
MFDSSYSDSCLHPLFFSATAATMAVPAYPATPPPHGLPRSYLQRRSSSHSLPFHHHHVLNSNASPPMRRVLSAGDLQGMMSCPNANHRVGRYSAEERKERIERYRSKRNQRNFRRKITYACRKTLADSRPRVRGRFKRNGEMETETEMEAANGNNFEFYSYDNAEHKQSKSRKVEVDWRSQLQAALAEEDQTGSCYDEELLAGFADAFSINIFS